MSHHWRNILSVLLAVFCVATEVALGCCPAGSSGRPVVNADQSVIIVWDAASKTEHFIRKASFKSDGDEFGFIVPTPSQPELETAGDEAFAFLAELTKPEVQTKSRPVSFGCSSPMAASVRGVDRPVTVLQEKMVAGFKATVLEADSSTALVEWLRENGFAFSQEIEEWAKPYITSGWKFTALKVVAGKERASDASVSASALRISFKTERPLFPYREPNPAAAAESLKAPARLLRIFFIAESRFEGRLTRESPWSGKAVWSGEMNGTERAKVRELLRLTEVGTPAKWRVTEFEDVWPYRRAMADLYFSKSADQGEMKRPPIVVYASSRGAVDVVMLAFVGFACWRLFTSAPRPRRCRSDSRQDRFQRGA